MPQLDQRYNRNITGRQGQKTCQNNHPTHVIPFHIERSLPRRVQAVQLTACAARPEPSTRTPAAVWPPMRRISQVWDAEAVPLACCRVVLTLLRLRSHEFHGGKCGASTPLARLFHLSAWGSGDAGFAAHRAEWAVGTAGIAGGPCAKSLNLSGRAGKRMARSAFLTRKNHGPRPF